MSEPIQDPLANVTYEEVLPDESAAGATQNLTEPPPEDLPTWSWWGMILSVLGAQLCCGLPWVLVSVGLSGSYISQLETLRPYRPLFITAAIGFFVAGWIVYIQRRRKGCPTPRPRH